VKLSENLAPSRANILAPPVSNAIGLMKQAIMPVLMGMPFIDDARRSVGSQQS
jgi:hypothetical protein